MSEQSTATFSELIEAKALEIGDGYRAKLEELGGDGPIFLRAGLLTSQGIEWNEGERFQSKVVAGIQSKLGFPGDTMVTTKGNSVGRAGYVPDGSPPFVYSPHLSYWRSRDTSRLSPGFLRYWVHSPEFTDQLRAMASSTDMAPYLSLSDQRRLRISLPEVRVQEAIGSVLGALDDKVAVNDRITGLSSDLISSLFAQALERPGSTATLLGDVMNFDFGLPFSSDSFNSDQQGLPLLRIRDIKTFAPQVWTTERIARDVVVQPGDVVAGMDAEFRPAFWLGNSALLNQRVLRGRPLAANGGRSFVREVLRKPLSEIEGHKTGTTVIHLNKRDLDSSFAEVPEPSALAEFEAAAEPLRCRIVAAAEESRSLIQLRDTLLPKLVSGEIRVRDAEKVVEKVT